MTLAMLLCCVTAMAWAESEYPYGDGTKDNPYQFEVTTVYDEDYECYDEKVTFKGGYWDEDEGEYIGYSPILKANEKVYATFEMPEENKLIDFYISDYYNDLYEDVTVYKNGDEGTPVVFDEIYGAWILSEYPATVGDRIVICATVKSLDEYDYAEFYMNVDFFENFGTGSIDSPYILERSEESSYDGYDFYGRPEDAMYSPITGKDEVWYVLQADRKSNIRIGGGSYSEQEARAFTGGEVYIGSLDNKVAEMSEEVDEYYDELAVQSPFFLVEKGDVVYVRLSVNDKFDEEEYGYLVYAEGKEYTGAGTLDDPFIIKYDYEEEIVVTPETPALEPGDYYFSMDVARDDWLVFNSSTYGVGDVAYVEFCDADGNTIEKFKNLGDKSSDFFIGDVKATEGQNIKIKVHLVKPVEEWELWVGVEPNELYGYFPTKKFTFTYTGKAIKPLIYADDMRYQNLLVKGRDYTVTYSNNIKVGEGKATITPTGEYAGLKKTYVFYDIVPKKASIKSMTPGSKKLTVKASTKVSSTGGSTYQIAYKQKGTSKWKYTTTTSQSKTIKSLKKGKYYYVKVRAYKTVKGIKFYGSWSTTKLSKKIK